MHSILEECGLTAVVFVIGERADGIKAVFATLPGRHQFNQRLEVADFQNHTDGHNGPTSNPRRIVA